jgi:hypothetical protein
MTCRVVINSRLCHWGRWVVPLCFQKSLNTV